MQALVLVEVGGEWLGEFNIFMVGDELSPINHLTSP